jgi:hypothetical protein
VTTDLPSPDAFAGVDPGVLLGRVAQRAEAVSTSTYDFAWQRDQAYVQAIDDALGDALDGCGAPPGGTPRWLEGLVRRELRASSETSWSRGRFLRVRLLERLGLVTLEPDDTYVLAMVSALGPHKADRLRSDPDLVERALWRVFEVEGGGEVSLTNVDRFDGSQWRTAFLELTADGTLDRSRVLAECLRALGRDFAAYRAGWFSATYLALEPTAEESADLQPALRRLLSAAVPATVAFALKELVRVQKAGRLDVAETLAALPAATLVPAKGTALAALRLARGAGTDHRDAVVTVATAALGHPHADVQRTAAEMLTASGESRAVADAGAGLAPSVRHELGLTVGQDAPDRTPPVQGLAPVPPAVARSELAERTACLLEDTSDAMELEAVLAALVRPGSEDALAPLRTRARAVVARGPGTLHGDSWLPGQVARVVLSLLGDPAPAADPDLPAARFVVRRLAELRRTTAPLLATPDLPGGWVSPAALVDRLAADAQPRHHDLTAALLRLHPDGRAQLSTPDLPAAVRFALDGLAPTRRTFGGRPDGPAAWWVAAERSRAPYAADEAPRLDGTIETHTWQENGRDRRSRYARFGITTSLARRPADDQPTELAAGRADQWGAGHVDRYLGDWIPTLAVLWPHDAEHVLSLTALPVLEAPSWTETAHDVPLVLDALARHPGRMGDLAAHALAAGISATTRDHRLHAVDAFLDLVPTGRVPVEQVAAVLARYAEAWPATRWAESLGAVGRGPGGAASVVALLTALLPQLPVDHRRLNALLDLLRDETLRSGARVDDPALVSWLSRLTGSSAAARTARTLLR